MNKLPCYNCFTDVGYKPDVKRSVGCHAKCKYYLAWKKEKDKANKTKRKKLDSYYTGFHFKQV